ncbi:MAG: methyltransferase domain-containing protein [Prevotellaceae bacterium]|nr:methyltransferase domain-containing protein [Prevotellaceae bacterium]
MKCPVCGKAFEEPALHCKDYRVTGEVFDIYVCPDCGFGMTFPQPSPAEIGKYYQTPDYVSHSETKQGFVNKLYHLVRKINTKSKLKLITRYSKAPYTRLLDVGCGTGYFLSVCKKDGWLIEGVEVDEGARSIAETRLGQPICSSIDEMIASRKQFDVITLWHVFEHLYDINDSYEKLLSLLNPLGLLILALPNPTSPDAVYYKEHWAAYDVPRHLSHFSPMSLNRLADIHVTDLKSITGMKFDAYYVSIMSEELKGRGKISALLHGLWRGYLSNRRARKTNDYSSLIYAIFQS